MAELQTQSQEILDGKEPTCAVLPYQIAFNCFCHNSALEPNGYNEEEMKLVKETRKIFSCPEIAITGTCIRIPVLRAHCESINLEFTNPITPDEVRDLLNTAPGVTVMDDREHNRFPMPIDASGKGRRLRRSNSSGRIHAGRPGDQPLGGGRSVTQGRGPECRSDC